MKRICIIDFDMSVHGGVEKVSAALANALTEHFEVYLVSLFLSEESLAFELDEKVKFSVLLPQGDRLRYLAKKLKKPLPQYLRDNKIDAAILQGNYVGILTSLTCRKVRTKLIFFEHGALMNQWKQKDVRFMRWYASRKCSRTVVLTEQSREAYIKKFRLPKERVRCLYNWIDPDVPVSKAYDIASKRIVSAGRFGPEKGFDLLIGVAAPALRKHPDWSLDLYGDGEMKEKVEEEIRKHRMEEQITLCGTVDDMDERYGGYAMYVLPSYREGLPLVLLEAKANRLPIISFDIMTGPREIVTDGIDGILIEPYDTEKMSEAILRLIEEPETRQNMSDRSQDNIDKFSKEKITGQWIDLLEETIG